MVPNINEDNREAGLSFSNNKTVKYRDGRLAVQGAKLFNAMPKSIRNLKDILIDKFKKALDTHLTSPEVYTG